LTASKAFPAIVAVLVSVTADVLLVVVKFKLSILEQLIKTTIIKTKESNN
jgi:hypothetical protein